jgi:hypothetical protein
VIAVRFAEIPMKNAFPTLFGTVLLGLALHTPAVAQSEAKKAALVIPAVPETHLKKNVFAGNEAQISAMHGVRANCKSAELPDVRVVTAPSKGEVRFETVQLAVDRDKDNNRAHCNGKLVQAVGVFYKAKEDTGRDKLVLDVDFKNGTVKRFSYSVDVR